MMDGKLLLVTNTVDLSPEEIVARCKSLADIERGFKVLESDSEIGPVYHRLPDRFRAPRGDLLHRTDPLPRHAVATEGGQG